MLKAIKTTGEAMRSTLSGRENIVARRYVVLFFYDNTKKHIMLSIVMDIQHKYGEIGHREDNALVTECMVNTNKRKNSN